MDANIKILKEMDFKTTTWSGGDTTQIYIYPETAEYADQDFLYRISTARVLSETSSFTKLEDYNRILTVLEGSIELEQEHQKTSVHLNLLEQFQFGGEVPIISYGQCKDFNLMFQKNLEAQVRMIQMEKSAWELVLKPQTHYVLYLLSGSLSAEFDQEHISICSKEALVFNQIRKPEYKLKITRKEENTLLALCCFESNG